MMIRKLILAVCLLITIAVGGAVTAQDLPPLDELQPRRWADLRVEGGMCAFGDPYAFFARPASDTDLVIYFQGGGACWDQGTCTRTGPFDNIVVPVNQEIQSYRGIFEFNNPRNPVADFTMIFIPYCTGDIHTGSRSADETGLVNFNGAPNARAALAWTFANYPNVERVIVTGSSAGAYGAAYHASAIFAQYPEAEHILLGDAGVGVTAPGWGGLYAWGTRSNMGFDPVLNGFSEEYFTNGMYSGVATMYPSARVAQFTNAADTVQIAFYGFQGGSMTEWTTGMFDRLEALVGALPNFRAYVASGDAHTILASPEFYSLAENGVSFRDWFAALIDGDETANVFCTECGE